MNTPLAFFKGKHPFRVLIFATLFSICLSSCQFSPLWEEDTTAPTDTIGRLEGEHLGAPSGTEAESDIKNPYAPITTYRHPLTGAPVTEAQAKLRPIAVSIGNTASAMPQYGLSYASVLIEAPVEGGSTRLLALTCDYASAPCFGSIRSTRAYLEELCAAFDAISVHAGISDNGDTTPYPKCDSLDYISQNLKDTFYRDPSRSSPHNLMTSGELLSFALEDTGYRKTVTGTLPYLIATQNKDVTERPYKALTVDVPFSSLQRVCFRYDTSTGLYMRHQNDTPHTDAMTNRQLSFCNVILLFADSVTGTLSSGEASLSIDLTGEGEAVFCFGGLACSAIWKRNESTGKIALYTTNGVPLSVDIGTTYIGVVRTASMSSVAIG